ncbi:alpha-amylase family glycosyl hydrolase [Roseospira visakhapatnamensis]|nr:alpha-amylase family glycosyl hydrolase [Roseospira visakhapatnamensis]
MDWTVHPAAPRDTLSAGRPPGPDGPVESSDRIRELFTDPTLVPARWLFPPGAVVDILFGVRGCDGAEVRLRHDLSCEPGVWHEIPAQRVPEDVAPRHPALQQGDAAYHVRLQGPAREGAMRYQVGTVSPSGVVTWMPQARLLVFARSPWRSDMVGAAAMAMEGGRKVSGPVPRTTMTPGPTDWRRRLFYSLMLDRFARDARAAPEHSFVRHDPSSLFASHGGTLAGARDRLDYLAALGVGAVILSPVYVNDPDGYHGYHPLSLYTVDPRLGTMADLRTLVREAHKRDIAVVLDVVVNHMAPSLVWSRGADGAMNATFRYVTGDLDTPLFLPEDFRDPAFFHPPPPDGDAAADGDGSDDGDGDGLVGVPLFGFLDDWRTEMPDVRAMLIAHLKYWIAQTDIDGFRLDAVRHVDLDFWTTAIRDVSAYARAIGKTGFLTLGEHAGEDPAAVGVYSKQAGFSGMIDYPLFYRLTRAVVHRAAPLDTLRRYWRDDVWCYRDSRYNLGFIDNQDTSRFLHAWGRRFGDRDTARAALAAALAVLVLGPGLAAVYYGTEQEFSGECGTWIDADGDAHPHDAYVREDMFPNPDCAWVHGPLNTPAFPPYDTDTPTFRTIAHLAAARRRTPAVYAGNRYAALPWEPDILAWFMVPEDDTAEAVLVLVDLLGIGPWAGAPVDPVDLARDLPQPHARRIVCGASAGDARLLVSLGDGVACERDEGGRLRFRLGRHGVAMVGFSASGPGLGLVA